ncbi:hypothetical protein [Asticcacaulis sp.]|uniref:hypothetical protein n=1 Tax=Asticcacaulis sp. TaxID=1872648 RepID=UPI0031DF0FD8
MKVLTQSEILEAEIQAYTAQTLACTHWDLGLVLLQLAAQSIELGIGAYYRLCVRGDDLEARAAFVSDPVAYLFDVWEAEAVERADAFLNALKHGEPIRACGLPAMGGVPCKIDHGGWQYVPGFGGGAVAGKIGSAGPYVGVVFHADDIRAYVQGLPLPAPYGRDEAIEAARRDLQNAVDDCLSGLGPKPKAEEWQAVTAETYGLSLWTVRHRVWNHVRDSKPENAFIGSNRKTQKPEKKAA